MATNAPKLGSSKERDCGWLFTLPPLAGASSPRKAYSRVLESFQTTSEHLVLETKLAPALEPLLENIECWPVELVAAGGLQLWLSLFCRDARKPAGSQL